MHSLSTRPLPPLSADLDAATLAQGVEVRSLDAWNEAAARVFGDICIDAREGPFRARMRSTLWGGLGITTVLSLPAHVQGATQKQRPGVPLAPGGFILLNESGHSCVAQGGRRALLGPGELTVLRRGEPYSIRFDRINCTHVLALPSWDRRSAIDAHVALRHSAAEVPLLGALVARLASADSAAARALGGDGGIRLAHDLLALSWPVPQDEASEVAVMARTRGWQAWEARVRERIERELSDADLGAASIARTLGLSTRYVQLMFARRGTTVGAHILECRLQRAAQRLGAELGVGSGAVRIGELALELGFGDISHFCRCFKRRFGCSARDWRGAQRRSIAH